MSMTRDSSAGLYRLSRSAPCKSSDRVDKAGQRLEGGGVTLTRRRFVGELSLLPRLRRKGRELEHFVHVHVGQMSRFSFGRLKLSVS